MADQRIIPIRSTVAWSLAAAAATFGLALAHGFDGPLLRDAPSMARNSLVACVALFALSRLLMLFPASRLKDRLSRWWVDFVLLAAAAAWYTVDRNSDSFILNVGAIYVIVVGMFAAARAGIAALSHECACAVAVLARPTGGMAKRSAAMLDRPDPRGTFRPAIVLMAAALGLVLIGGTVLALPVCWNGPPAVEPGHPLAWYQLKMHWADCVFTAVAAVTGTGLTVQDVGRDFTRIGQTVVLVLMEIGGLGVLAVGAILGMRFRALLGWDGQDEDQSGSGLRRLVLGTLLLALLIQAAGAVAVYRMWDPAVDLNYATAERQPELLGHLARGRLVLEDVYDEARLFAAVFHSVSAFCDAGLTLTRDGYLDYRHHPAPLLALVPLMFLGSLGGPVLIEVIRRMTRRNDVGLEGTSRDTYVTLCGSIVVVLIGAGLLTTIESTRHQQLRYPRENTPGRLMLDTPAGDTASGDHAAGETAHKDGATTATATPIADARGGIEFSAASSRRARSERLGGMSTGDRVRSAVFHAEAARTGGARSARLDESSLSPASHAVMMVLMLVGGGIGGAAGGLRVTIVLLLLLAVWRAGKPASRDDSAGGIEARSRAMGIAAAIAAGMGLLIFGVAVALMYRESGSALACAFEAVSACCNNGLSTGLTNRISLAGRIVLMCGMLAGRLIPLIILLRALLPATRLTVSEIQEKSEATPPAAVVPDKDDSDLIPLA